jgi:type I restriction enzyme M protein
MLPLPSTHHFIVPKEAHWDRVRETTTNLGMAIQNAMRKIEKANPDTLHGIFGDASWTKSPSHSESSSFTSRLNML